MLGIELDNRQIAILFKRLQFDFTADGDDFRVTPPSFRFDLSIEADLIEELARLHGYDHIPARAPEAAFTVLPYSELRRPLPHIQKLLVARDYQEIVSYAFLDAQIERELCGNEHPVALQNPIARNMAVMRSSLIGGLVGALRFNLNRKQSRVRLFEVGACFARMNDEYVQTQRLSGLCYGEAQSEQWGVAARPVDFFDVKADVEALLRRGFCAFLPQSTRRCIPGVLGRYIAANRWLDGWASCIRTGNSNTISPKPACGSNSNSKRWPGRGFR